MDKLKKMKNNNREQIFNYVQTMNIYDFVNIINNLPEDSLAYKIATGRFSEKQLWVIAYELEKNNDFVKMVNNYYENLMAPLIAVKKLTAFKQWLKTNGNPYRSQYFSKNYTRESVDSFLQTLNK